MSGQYATNVAPRGSSSPLSPLLTHYEVRTILRVHMSSRLLMILYIGVNGSYYEIDDDHIMVTLKDKCVILVRRVESRESLS